MILLPRLLSAFALVITTSLALAQGGGESSKQPAPNQAGTATAAKKLEAARARLKKTGDTTYELGELKFNSATREVRVPTVLNMNDGVLEYALVHENGKIHESLLRTKVSPTELNLVLLLCNYEPHIGEAAAFLRDPVPSTKVLMNQPAPKNGANKLSISVQWKDKDGKELTAPIATWFLNKQTSKPMALDHWTYTGSLINDTGFAAEFDGSIIATYFDLVAMVNCPVEENTDDDIWYPEPKVVPPVDTPVTLVLTPAPAK